MATLSNYKFPPREYINSYILSNEEIVGFCENILNDNYILDPNSFIQIIAKISAETLHNVPCNQVGYNVKINLLMLELFGALDIDAHQAEKLLPLIFKHLFGICFDVME